MILPTIKVKRDGGKGVRIINASDYDPARHALADEQAGQAYQPVADAQTAPADLPKRRKRKAD